jgi:integration host factor subunit beta
MGGRSTKRPTIDASSMQGAPCCGLLLRQRRRLEELNQLIRNLILERSDRILINLAVAQRKRVKGWLLLHKHSEPIDQLPSRQAPITRKRIDARLHLSQEVSLGVGITISEAERVVETIFKVMVEALNRHERIEIRGFGVFTIHQRSARIGRNPITGEHVDVPAKKVVHFKPSKLIANALLASRQ